MVKAGTPDPAVLRRVPTQARSQEKVERALAAASALLEREGVGALTLTRVAREAGVSVGALYQYLPDRDTIVALLSAEHHARLEAMMDQLVADVGTVTDPVGAALSAVARLYREQAGVRAMRRRLQPAAQLGETRAHKARMTAKVVELLDALGFRAEGGNARVARTVFFAADALMHEAFEQDESGDATVLADLEDLLRAYLDQVPVLSRTTSASTARG